MRALVGLAFVAACWRQEKPPVEEPTTTTTTPVPVPSQAPAVAATPSPAAVAATPAPTPAAVAATPVAPTAAPAVIAAPPAPPIACAKDELVETVCGSTAPATTCGARGDSLKSFGVSFTSASFAGPIVYRDFALDQAATDGYRQSLATAKLPALDSYCCYSKCTRLVVAKTAPVPRPGAKQQLSMQCIPPPLRGTRVPAKADAACPGAIKIRGVMAPYMKSFDAGADANIATWLPQSSPKSCCYTDLVPRRETDGEGMCKYCRCAAAGTAIATPDGEVAIEDLRPGDLVLSIDRGQLAAVPLARVNRTPVHDHVMIRLTLDTGRTVAMSPQHPTGDGRTFEQLASGAQLGTARVLGADRIPYASPFTYDILPESDSGTYVAGGALVGSTLFHAR